MNEGISHRKIDKGLWNAAWIFSFALERFSVLDRLPSSLHKCVIVVWKCSNSSKTVDFQKSPSTSSLAVGRFAAKKGSLRWPSGQLVASLAKPVFFLVSLEWSMNYSYILFFSILDKQQTLYITVSQLSLLPDYGYSAVIAEKAHTCT